MVLLNARQFAELLPKLVAHPRVTLGRTEPAEIVLETATPKFKLHLAGGLAMLQAKLDCFSGGKPVASLTNEVPWLPDPACPTRFCPRQSQAEQAARAQCARSAC